MKVIRTDKRQGTSLRIPRVTLAFGMALIVAHGSISCRAQGGGQSLDSVFSGFRLLERRELKRAPREPLTTPVINTTNGEPTRDWLAGYIYLLRMPAELTSGQLALAVLPNRLSQVGADIISAPRSPTEVVTITIGGPLFRIEFKRGGVQGVIYNTIAKVNEHAEEILVVELR